MNFFGRFVFMNETDVASRKQMFSLVFCLCPYSCVFVFLKVIVADHVTMKSMWKFCVEPG
jgi:hypothetical protein